GRDHGLADTVGHELRIAGARRDDRVERDDHADDGADPPEQRTGGHRQPQESLEALELRQLAQHRFRTPELGELGALGLPRMPVPAAECQQQAAERVVVPRARQVLELRGHRDPRPDQVRVLVQRDQDADDADGDDQVTDGFAERDALEPARPLQVDTEQRAACRVDDRARVARVRRRVVQAGADVTELPGQLAVQLRQALHARQVAQVLAALREHGERTDADDLPRHGLAARQLFLVCTAARGFLGELRHLLGEAFASGVLGLLELDDRRGVAHDLATGLHLAQELEPDPLELPDGGQGAGGGDAHHELGALLLALGRGELGAGQRAPEDPRGVAGDLAGDTEQLTEVALVLPQQRADLLDALLVRFPLAVELLAVRLRPVAPRAHFLGAALLLGQVPPGLRFLLLQELRLARAHLANLLLKLVEDLLALTLLRCRAGGGFGLRARRRVLVLLRRKVGCRQHEGRHEHGEHPGARAADRGDDRDFPTHHERVSWAAGTGRVTRSGATVSSAMRMASSMALEYLRSTTQDRELRSQ